jgi:hypothetical protein
MVTSGKSLIHPNKKGIKKEEKGKAQNRRRQQSIHIRPSEPFRRTNLPLLSFSNDGPMTNNVQQY